MEEQKQIIRAECPLFACRACRTKTGWHHQAWCPLSAVTRPECRDCCYRGTAEDICMHPAKQKEVGAE